MYLETLISPVPTPAEPQPTTPVEAVSSAIQVMSKPWTNAKIIPPHFSVLETARTAGLSPQEVIQIVSNKTNRLPCKLQNKSGQRINGNLHQAAIDSAPFKRIARLAGGKQNSFGEVAFILGLRRLRIQPNT